MFVHAHAGMQSLKLKIPPLALGIVAASVMRLGAASFPTLDYRFPLQALVAGATGLSGVLACALGLIEFRRVKTTVNPTQPPRPWNI